MKNRPKRVVNKTKNKIVSSKTLHPRTLLPKINLQNKQKQGMLYQNCDFSERQSFILYNIMIVRRIMCFIFIFQYWQWK